MKKTAWMAVKTY